MGRMKLGIAVAGAVVVLLGVVAMVTMRSNGGSDHATNVASQSPATTVASGASYVSPTVPPMTAAPKGATPKAPPAPATTSAAPATAAPANGTPTSVVPQPSAQDIQKLIAGITAQIQAPAATGTTAPLTAAQVEAQVREQLKQLGITY